MLNPVRASFVAVKKPIIVFYLCLGLANNFSSNYLQRFACVDIRLNLFRTAIAKLNLRRFSECVDVITIFDCNTSEYDVSFAVEPV